MPRGIGEDTLADKVTRFVIGSLMGAGAGWLLVNQVGQSMTDGEHIKTILVVSAIIGLASALLGDHFIEAFINRGWWR